MVFSLNQGPFGFDFCKPAFQIGNTRGNAQALLVNQLFEQAKQAVNNG